MKNIVIALLALWAALASVIAVKAILDLEKASLPTELYAGRDTKSIDVVATQWENGLSYTVQLTNETEKVDDYSQYDGLVITKGHNLLGWTESICTEYPALNDYTIEISVPEKGIERVSLPITLGLCEIIKAAFHDNVELTFILEYKPDWKEFTWKGGIVLPDYPQTFWEWNE